MSATIGDNTPTTFLGKPLPNAVTDTIMIFDNKQKSPAAVSPQPPRSTIGCDRPVDFLPLSSSPSPYIDPSKILRRAKILGHDPQDVLPLKPTKSPLRGGTHRQKLQDVTSLPLMIVKDNDVLRGRGGLSNNHPGNRLFRRLIQHNRSFYQNLENPTQKQLLVYSIVAAIEGKGGRFLRMHNGKWVQASLNSVRREVGKGLHNSPRPT
jgi:hypothetical protein